MTDGLLIGFLSALWLGILTSISPCPLATNIAAISFISRDLATPRKVFLTGTLYTLGRAVTYLVLGALLVGSLLSIPHVSNLLQRYMNKLLGPILILVGMFLLDLLAFRFSTSAPVTERMQKRMTAWGIWGAAPLGMLFALAFCPVSAALFFGSLIPLAVRSGSSLALPSLYGIGTGLPVLVFGFLIALGAQTVSKAFNKLTHVERWARAVTGGIFIVVGIYFSLAHIFAVIS
ncbi:MAG TPA: aromatic aminobenezylarsenical efflux permease ArsG family transporter [Terriglobia bacterium]|jgi:cytochrome c biogenesis protein CcdA|nr:aromatic aminobenezylarsenical efflux permease ArsG family transporter [Terriglobia bacterium]